MGACIGSGRDSSSRVLIDGGTICLVDKNNDSGIGMLLILEREYVVIHRHKLM